MKTPNFKEKIQLYLKTNPKLKHDHFGTLLLIDTIYGHEPEGMEDFRELYSHLDPNIIDKNTDGITFLKIAADKKCTDDAKEHLNSYINMKYNYIGHGLSYKENMKRFKVDSMAVTQLIDDVLHTAKFPEEIIEVLREHESVRDTHDLFDLLCLYKKTDDKRVKYEILRKIGLIVLISRIKRSYLIEDIDNAIEGVTDVFYRGLGLTCTNKQSYHVWIDEHDKVVYTNDKDKAHFSYRISSSKRVKSAFKIYPMQRFDHTPLKTKFGTDILHFETRNKLRLGEEERYTSVVEKIVRKNLEFPNLVRDTIGVRLVVNNEKEIPDLIKALETFLGGSSTRKKEKNAFNMFGRQKLNMYSLKDFYVWKAIYDIALPHPSISQVKKVISLTHGNKTVQDELKKRLYHFKDRPQDFVVEVQIQDMNSYLLGKAKGSTTDHELLKMNQIRQNSFYKFFPKEIYNLELIKLRNQILNNGN